MIAEDFGPVCVLATESIAGTTVEVARAHTGPKDRRGRGQRTVSIPQPSRTAENTSGTNQLRHGTKRLGEICGLAADPVLESDKAAS